jgi:flagellum-specific ATP synthase
MAGSGVGKSTLLGMIARYTEADVNVIALIGERGRELREFVEKDLQEQGLHKSVVVVATSDQPPLVRMRGAYIATTIAEYFKDQGKKVLLMMDSATRFAMAMREVGLAIGEPPTTKGYTPSVFAALPKLLERTGNFPEGSITGLYTVLVEGDDFNEPISDAMRSILDGHIVLSRAIAAKNHYPAIDILGSASRVMRDIVSSRHLELAGQARTILATYKEAEDLINIGAYAKGSNPKIDYAITKIDAINDFLQQDINESTPLKQTIEELGDLLSGRKDDDQQKRDRRGKDQGNR